MTIPQPRRANALAVHFGMEPFQTAAAPALAAWPLVPEGQCLNPGCSRTFVRTRDWQVYCCNVCRQFGDREMRRIGLKAAPALLAWRMGKYEKSDEDLRALSRAGRNYIARLQSDWFADRKAREERAARHEP
jgi:hypothetical protein